MRSTHLKSYCRDNLEASHSTRSAYFLKAPFARFRIFGESRIARLPNKQQLLEFINAAIAIKSLRIILEHNQVVIVAQSIMSQKLVCLQLDAEILVEHIALIIAQCLARPISTGGPLEEKIKSIVKLRKENI